jgi:type VI protein secretion system component Hcp
MVSSYQVGGSAWSDAVPTESISLNFAKIEESYTEYSPSGTPEGQTDYGWDVAQNAAL